MECADELGDPGKTRRRRQLVTDLRVRVAVIACLLGTAQASAEERGSGTGTQADVEVEVYTAPQRKERVAPVYPRNAMRSGREGWVRMHFMVGADGRPYEIDVTDSMGDRSFHGAARRALEKSLFEPARRNGTPLDAGLTQKYVFEIRGPAFARPSFLAAFRTARQAIGADDRDQAAESIDRLAPRDHYEDALLQLAKFHYLRKWGEPEEQLAALDRAIAHETTAKYLPEAVFVSSLVAQFGLLTHTRDFARALETFETLQGFDLDPDTRASLQVDVDVIQALKNDERAYDVAGEIDDSANWYFDLFKDDFAVLDVDGKIAEVKLRCQRGYVFWRFDPELVYHLGDDYGDCHLTLVGDPGTTFRLRQM